MDPSQQGNGKKTALIALAILVVILAIVAGLLYLNKKNQKTKLIISFEDCAKAGYLVVDTQPRECHTKTGQVFLEQDNHLLLQNYIVVTEPKPYQKVTTPFKVEGKARDNWFFNSQISIKLLDANHKVITTKLVKKIGEKKEDFTSFVAAIDFLPPETEKGRLIIEKTDPNDREGPGGPLVIPLTFK